jgi:hypothetical protein
MLQWLRRRRQAERLAQADAEALVRDHGAEAYREARERERDVILPDGTTHAGRTPAHWHRVALIVARMMGKRVGVDTATRMLERGDGVGRR